MPNTLEISALLTRCGVVSPSVLGSKVNSIIAPKRNRRHTEWSVSWWVILSASQLRRRRQGNVHVPLEHSAANVFHQQSVLPNPSNYQSSPKSPTRLRDYGMSKDRENNESTTTVCHGYTYPLLLMKTELLNWWTVVVIWPHSRRSSAAPALPQSMYNFVSSWQ